MNRAPIQEDTCRLTPSPTSFDPIPTVLRITDRVCAGSPILVSMAVRQKTGGRQPMRTCPLCHCDLAPVNYEGHRILLCDSCGGHLLSSSVRRAIENITGFTRSELAGEALARYRGSHPERIACPRCFRTMDKRSLCLPGVSAEFDVCRDCDLVWLDGGELAMLQMNHESSEAFMDAQEMRSRVKELESDPERLAKFQEALSRMPLEPSDANEVAWDLVEPFLSDVPTESLPELIGRMIRKLH